MNALSKLAVGAALSVALIAPVSAAVVQGISFPTPANNLQIDSGSFLQSLNTSTGVLSGYGLINSFDNGGTPITPGFELTYTFGGFTLDTVNSSLTRLVFTGGEINIYSDNTPNFNINNSATASDTPFATPFLTLSGHMFLDLLTPSLETGTIVAGLTAGNFMVDVSGGEAAPYFDTDTIGDFMLGTADLQGASSVVNYLTATGTVSSSTFVSQVLAAAGGAGIDPFAKGTDVLGFFKNTMGYDNVVATGSIDLTGATQAVPEPATIALLGGALLGLAVTRRRRS